ncbi:MAG: aminotransferase class I/II-fold pyridoxal phosphate-dependent enzyme [Opitutae bacterium]|nr:aminotransferase class I/II-fold pyridoxal phosphate-dependent enzyme [Opitutae bacterium]
MSRIYLSPPDISKQDRSAIDSAFDSGWVAPVGPDLDAFEAEVAKRVNRSYACAVNSGTSALHLALLALDIKPGDKVICPSLTFAGCAFPISYCGAEPVFVDSETETWNMDPGLLQKALETLADEGSKPKAVIVVQIYGQCAKMDEIIALCKAHQIPLIEDAAESLGASYKGKPAGSFGDLSFLSFNGNKIITTSGGGMLLGNDQALIEKARYFSQQAREPVLHYEHKAIGYNYRLSNLLAALGRSQITDLDRRIAVRKEHFQTYAESLGKLPGISFMPISDDGSPNYWLSCLIVDDSQTKVTRDNLIDICDQASIEVRPTWKPLHLQTVFQAKQKFGGAISEDLFNHGLCLPSGSSLTHQERDKVISILTSALS